MDKLVKILPFILLALVLFMVTGAFNVTVRIASFIYAIIYAVLLFLQFKNKSKAHVITLSLVFFLFAEILSASISAEYLGAIYHSVNGLYIIAYSCLIYFLFTRLDISLVWQKLKYFILVLSAFLAFFMFYLNDIMLDERGMVLWSFSFFIETLYNFIILLLLVLSFINFLYYDSKKGLLLFLACILLVFSEMIQLTYIYIINNEFLFILMSVFRVLGLFAMYYYVQTREEDNTSFELLN